MQSIQPVHYLSTRISSLKDNAFSDGTDWLEVNADFQEEEIMLKQESQVQESEEEMDDLADFISDSEACEEQIDPYFSANGRNLNDVFKKSDHIQVSQPRNRRENLSKRESCAFVPNLVPTCESRSILFSDLSALGVPALDISGKSSLNPQIKVLKEESNDGHLLSPSRLGYSFTPPPGVRGIF